MTTLTPTEIETLIAVAAGHVVRMPDGGSWDVNRGSYRSGMEALRLAGLVTLEPRRDVAVDRTYELTPAGRAAFPVIPS